MFLAQRAIRGDQVLRHQPELISELQIRKNLAASQRSVFGTTSTESAEPTYTAESATQINQKKNQN